MPAVGDSVSRIDKEFAAVEGRIKLNPSQQVDACKRRQGQLEQFETTLDHLRDVWRPRLEAFAE